MSNQILPAVIPSTKPTRWWKWRKLTIVLLVISSFLGYTGFTLNESYHVNAAHVRIGVIGSQLQMFSNRFHPERLTLDSALKLLRKDHSYITSDGTGRYNLNLIGDQFVLFTSVMREGFSLKRVVVVYTRDKGPKALPEADFLARVKTGGF